MRRRRPPSPNAADLGHNPSVTRAAKIRLSAAVVVAVGSVVFAAATIAAAGSSMSDIWMVFLGVPLVVGFGLAASLLLAGRRLRYALLTPLPLFLLLLGTLAADGRNLGTGGDQLVVLTMTTVGTLLGMAPVAAFASAHRAQRKGAARGRP